jgi:hypothetical protein
MSGKSMTLSILAVVFVLTFGFGAYAQAQQISVDRDFGPLHRTDVNRFGDDRAVTSTSRGTDRDADFRMFNFVPNTYGLMGDYSYDSGGG